MPSRVRLVGSHPKYGLYKGADLCKFVLNSWDRKFPMGICPAMFDTWPRWKRVLWKAKSEGAWQIKAFRETRRARAKKSKYGELLIKWGFGIPKLKKKYKKEIKPPKVRVGLKRVGNIEYVAIDPRVRPPDIQNVPVNPWYAGVLDMAAQGLINPPPQVQQPPPQPIQPLYEEYWEPDINPAEL